jgi:hypothetical protein
VLLDSGESIFFKGSQTEPFCTSGKRNMKMKTNTDFCENYIERKPLTLKMRMKLVSVLNIISYRTVNTLPLGYKSQNVSLGRGHPLVLKKYNIKMK